MERKKILFVNNVVSDGGVGKVMQDIVNNLPKDKFEITIYNFLKDEEFYKIYDGKEINYIYEFDIDYNTIEAIGTEEVYKIIYKSEESILKKLDDMNFDIVVSMRQEFVPQIVCKLKCNNKICWVHSSSKNRYYESKNFNKKEEFECMKKFNKIICVAESSKKFFIREIGDTNNLYVRYNPIDNNEIIRKSKEKVDFEVSNEFLNFITVGRISEEKGYDRLIEASNKLLDEGYKFNLYLVGDGFENYMKYLTNRVKYKDYIHFLGKKQNPYPYLLKADCFINSSMYEAYCLAVQEAIILHIPIIMTNYFGSEEAFESGKAGIIVENSEKGIYDGMLEILTHKEKLQKYKKYLEKDNYVKIEKRIKDIIELFEE